MTQFLCNFLVGIFKEIFPKLLIFKAIFEYLAANGIFSIKNNKITPNVFHTSKINL